VPLCPPQIPHDLTWVRTRAAAVGSRRLTARAMERPYVYVSLTLSVDAGKDDLCNFVVRTNISNVSILRSVVCVYTQPSRLCFVHLCPTAHVLIRYTNAGAVITLRSFSY
jgi:hypothetical protein